MELGKLEGGHSTIFPQNGFIEMQDICTQGARAAGMDMELVPLGQITL